MVVWNSRKEERNGKVEAGFLDLGGRSAEQALSSLHVALILLVYTRKVF